MSDIGLHLCRTKSTEAGNTLCYWTVFWRLRLIEAVHAWQRLSDVHKSPQMQVVHSQQWLRNVHYTDNAGKPCLNSTGYFLQANGYSRKPNLTMAPWCAHAIAVPLSLYLEWCAKGHGQCDYLQQMLPTQRLFMLADLSCSMQIGLG